MRFSRHHIRRVRFHSVSLVTLFITVVSTLSLVPASAGAEFYDTADEALADLNAGVYNHDYESHVVLWTPSGSDQPEFYDFDTQLDETGAPTANIPDPSALESGDRVDIYHNHPLHAFGHPHLGESRLTEEVRQDVVSGNRIPPAGHPSLADWQQAASIASDYGSETEVQFHVVDPAGTWTFGFGEDGGNVQQYLQDITRDPDGVSVLPSPEDYGLTDADADVLIYMADPANIPWSDDPLEQQAQIDALRAKADSLGMVLDFSPGAEYQNSGAGISGVVYEDNYATPGGMGNSLPGMSLAMAPSDPADAVDGSDSSGTTVASDSGSGGTTGGGIVPCGNEVRVEDMGTFYRYHNECTVCDMERLLQRIINWLVTASVIVAALLFVNSGVLYVTSPGNLGNIQRAHKIFTNTLIGIIIILAAWLLIDVVMKTLLTDGEVKNTQGTNYGPWNEILCTGYSSYYDVAKVTQATYTAKPLTLPDIKDLPPADCSTYGGTCVSAFSGCPSGYSPNHALGEAGACKGAFLLCCLPSSSESSCQMSDGSTGKCYSTDLCSGQGGTGEISAECGGISQGQYCCKATLKPNPGDPNAAYDCSDPASLQARFGGRGAVNGPGLNAMISCYENDSEVKKWRDHQSVYTYENANPLCNYTNGQPVCGSCAHSKNSCHYGRGTGYGALAADFNGTNEAKLCLAIKRASGKCGGRVLCESTHTHVSLDSCPGGY